MIRRFAVAMGSAVTLTGAFVVGAVLHQSLVQNRFPLTSPAGIFGLGIGVVVIAVGLGLEGRFEPSDYVPDPEEDEKDEEAFDEELSPLSGDTLENRERDESYEG